MEFLLEVGEEIMVIKLISFDNPLRSFEVMEINYYQVTLPIG